MEVTHAIQGHPRADIQPLLLDLSSLDSVRKAAERVLQMTLVVDVLINNAGVMMTPTYQTTPEGLEWHFGVNYIGHFLFTNLIMPALLKAADGACVVNVSSAAHRAIGVNFDDVNFQVC
jgi:NAD(P)-dependent dehydrogenase (short-subunit alcohol dehydrogenase family)